MSAKKLRVVSYNIHKGFSTGNKKFILNGIRDALQSVQPDVILLQEVQGQHDHHQKNIQDWPEQSQFEFLAHELWPHFTYGKNAVYDHGHHGNAILSRYPLVSSENINISTNRFERRGLLHAVVSVPSAEGGGEQPLHLICVHLDLLESGRAAQVQKLCSRIESHVPHAEPLLIGGDFNDWRGRVSHTIFKQLSAKEVFLDLKGSHARSFPAWMPSLRLDRIYYRGLTLGSASCLSQKPWSELSDHAALMAEFTLKKFN